MTQREAIKVFEQRTIRSLWDDEAEKWFFSIVDVVAVLTDSPNPQVYWRVLKKRLKDEGNQTVTNCNGFKMQAPDGKMRKTDCADTEPGSEPGSVRLNRYFVNFGVSCGK